MDDDLLPLLTVGYVMHRQQEDDEDQRRKRSKAIEAAREADSRRTAMTNLRREELDARAIHGTWPAPAGPDPRLTAEPQTISM